MFEGRGTTECMFQLTFITPSQEILAIKNSSELGRRPSTKEMPRGYLKHKKSIGRKASRGGGSRSDGRSRDWAAYRGLQSDKARRDSLSLLVDEDMVDINWGQHVDSEDDNVSMTTTSSFILSQDECAICLEVRPLVQFMKRCKHPQACHSCLRAYIVEAQTDVSNYPLKCFHPSCQRLVRDRQLQQHGLTKSPDELIKHHRLSTLAKAYAGTKTVTHCPVCDQPSYYQMPTSGIDRTVLCKNCKTKYDVEIGVTRVSSTLAAVEAFGHDNAGRNDGWARCPKCRMIISKGDGCEWMNCPCGQFFIWSDAVRSTDKNKARKFTQPTKLT
jgi:hypothetical protein